jgi:nucleotide-binding universal stress UspA family protein
MMAKRILVPVGNDERVESILPVAAALARESGGTIRLVQVQPLQRTRFDEYARRLPLYGYDASERIDLAQRVLTYAHAHEERLESETLERLHAFAPLLDGVAVEWQVRFGDVVEEIVREAEAFGADVVTMYERRRPWWRPRVSPIGERVRARAGVPVLTLTEARR